MQNDDVPENCELRVVNVEVTKPLDPIATSLASDFRIGEETQRELANDAVLAGLDIESEFRHLDDFATR